VLNDLDVQSYNALFGEALNTHRAAIGLPPVDNAPTSSPTTRGWRRTRPWPLAEARGGT
jgi:vancomycin aglycone glucosyltransferase